MSTPCLRSVALMCGGPYAWYSWATPENASATSGGVWLSRYAGRSGDHKDLHRLRPYKGNAVDTQPSGASPGSCFISLIIPNCQPIPNVTHLTCSSVIFTRFDGQHSLSGNVRIVMYPAIKTTTEHVMRLFRLYFEKVTSSPIIKMTLTISWWYLNSSLLIQK